MKYNYSLIKAESLYGDLTATGIIQYFDNNKLIMSVNNDPMLNNKENFFLSIFSKKEGVLVYEARISKVDAKNIEFTNNSNYISIQQNNVSEYSDNEFELCLSSIINKNIFIENNNNLFYPRFNINNIFWNFYL